MKDEGKVHFKEEGFLNRKPSKIDIKKTNEEKACKR